MEARESRTYIRVHDGMPDHPKIDGLSDAAFRLLIETWCWCSRHLTDGHVPAGTWTKRGTPKSRRELVSAGLVEPGENGAVVMHDYTAHQRSRAEVEAAREQRRAAGRAGGLARGKAKPKRVAKRAASESLSEPPSGSEAKPKQETEVVPTNLTSFGSGARSAPPADTLDIDVPAPDPDPPEVHAGTVVAAWTEACAANDVRPTAAQRAQVGRLARELLTGGNDPERVLAAAAQAGARGYVTIDRELTVMAGRAPAAAAQPDRLLEQARRNGAVIRDADPGRPTCPRHPEFPADACPECEDTP